MDPQVALLFLLGVVLCHIGHALEAHYVYAIDLDVTEPQLLPFHVYGVHKRTSGEVGSSRSLALLRGLSSSAPATYRPIWLCCSCIYAPGRLLLDGKISLRFDTPAGGDFLAVSEVTRAFIPVDSNRLRVRMKC
jgi:hypothetical protein